jgi:Fe-S cluster assembly protein SufD
VAINAPDEVVVESVERGDARLGRAGEPGDRVAAQAWASHAQAVIVTVPAETVTTRATVLRHSGDGGPSVAAFGHVLVDVKPFAQATVVLEHTGSVTYADNVELRVGDGASLVVVSIADWDDDAVHVSQHNISLGRDARIKHVVVSFGGDVVRVSTNVAYDGPGGDAELLGLYFADAGQHLENRLFVDHAVPALPEPGDLQGRPAGRELAHRLGRRRADPGGREGTDTYELNRNLLLTEGARADSVPNLEIETGRSRRRPRQRHRPFDDEQLFYLQSRGSRPTRRAGVGVRGFFADIQQIRRPTASRAASRGRTRAPTAGAGLVRPPLHRPRGRRRPSGACDVDIAGLPVAWCAAARGLRAIHDVCSHADGRAVRVAESRTARFECWLHGSRFDLAPVGPHGCRPPAVPLPRDRRGR